MSLTTASGHFLRLKSQLGAVGLMAAGCCTKGFYSVVFCIKQAIRCWEKSVKYSKDTAR